jgi:hypothetical protein
MIDGLSLADDSQFVSAINDLGVCLYLGNNSWSLLKRIMTKGSSITSCSIRIQLFEFRTSFAVFGGHNLKLVMLLWKVSRGSQLRIFGWVTSSIYLCSPSIG